MKFVSRVLLVVLLGVLLTPQSAHAFSGGFVEGQVTLKKENSPYRITSTIKIPSDASLTVEPGVVINVSHKDVVFESAGSLSLLGTSTSRIQINGASSLWKTAAPFWAKSNLEMRFVDAFGLDSIFTALNQGQNIRVIDSRFMGKGQGAPSLSFHSRLTFCTDCSLERNIFVDLPGFWFNTDDSDARVSVRNNLFVGNGRSACTGCSDFNSDVWLATDGSAVIDGNNFIGFSKPIIQMIDGERNVNLSGNYFGGKTAPELSGFILRDFSVYRLEASSVMSAPVTGVPVSAPAITPVPNPSVSGKASVPKAPTPIKYKNCAALQKVYAGGVALSSKSVNKGGKIKLKPTVNAKVYNLNKSLDRDKDGIACER